MQYKKWTIKLISILLIGIALILTLLYILKIAMFSYSDRIPNIRKINKEYRLNLIQEYINFKFDKNRTYDIIIGDSQFYGFKQYEEETFAYRLNRKLSKNKVINLSIVDATEKDMILVLKILQNKNVNIENILFNFNLAHFSMIMQENKIFNKHTVVFTNLYMIKLLEDYWLQTIKQTLFNKTNSQKYDSQKYDKKRYDIVNTNNKNLVTLVKMMQNISKKALVIFSPHSIDSLESSNYNVTKFKNSIKKYKRLINKTHCNTLDLTFEFQKKDFLDILHLSISGHKKMQNLILKYYKQEK